MIIQKIEDFRIYVEDDDKNYISSEFIKKNEESLSKRIGFNIKVGDKVNFTIELTRQEVKSLTNLLNETIKFL